ncbi:QRFP-like peptide receptor [Chionoecetes opilio]|uniref:QRFP-like peptide receptor n=1 Tax=Chionoecetes opilio TaxID=41210 RepID=A0A8J4XRC3_CHIOP|nr:QRFP-like peptide receptor [Chionoecetes opilio]
MFQAALLQRWNLPEFMCAFCPFFQTVSVNVSIFTLTAIAVDRYRAIVHPLSAQPSKYRSKVVITFIWLFSVTLAIPNAIALKVTYPSTTGQARSRPGVSRANVLQLQVITGPSRGDDFYLPRVPMITQAASGTGFCMRRLQFPIRVAFAMTINKCQGQTKSYVGVYLPTPVFTQGLRQPVKVWLCWCRRSVGAPWNHTERDLPRGPRHFDQ